MGAAGERFTGGYRLWNELFEAIISIARDHVGITHLAYYSDPSARVFENLKTAGKAFGMPTTLIVDPSGCEIGNIAGPAEWASDDGVKLVGAAIRKRS